jgi:hypothetical protein
MIIKEFILHTTIKVMKNFYALIFIITLVSCNKVKPILDEIKNPPGVNDITAGLSNDLSVWPNKKSYTNSDQWLINNHDKIEVLKPRVLLIDFYNRRSAAECLEFTNKVINAMAEGSRFQGYKNPGAAAQVQYTLTKYLDLRDNSGKDVSDKRPHKADGSFDQAGLFTDAFAPNLGYRDKTKKRWLRLGELFDLGIINECWVIGPNTVYEAQGRVRKYDANLRFTGYYNDCLNGCYDFGEAGRQTSVSIRLGEINPDRGPGCATHAFGHAIERMAEDIIYFKNVAERFFNFNLDQRYGAPFLNQYQSPYNTNPPECFIYNAPSRIQTVNNYLPAWTFDNWGEGCGNFHFPINGKFHYDYYSTQTLPCSCENYGKNNGPGGSDQKNNYDYSLVSRWNTDAYNDCGGEYIIYLRQNMPGYKNGRTGDDGKPMKSWWPFLYY